MRQRLYEYLLDRPGGATAADLLGLVFSGPGRDPAFGPRFVETLLGTDPRFAFDRTADRWRVRAHDLLLRPLDGVTFVVVDLETTGGGVGESGITEIGAVRVVNGRLVDRFATLVNPGRRIQPFVVHLTGISDAMVADAPPMSEVLPRFLAFAGPDPVLVAHNAGFDVPHLRHAHQTLYGQPLDLPAVCTIRLARRLLPDLRRRSLDSVAGHLGLGAAGRHRALPDAETAAEILTVFLERARQRGVERLDQLLDFQSSAADDRPFVVHVPRERLAALPAVPGVYHLLGADRRVLYVGKAVRLRERVASYFTNARRHARKTLELVRQVYDVEVTETGSELAASLLEARRIHELQPPFNRQRRHLPRVSYVKLGVTNAFPRVWTSGRLTTDRALHLGPFVSPAAAEQAATTLARHFGLRTCAGSLAPSPDVSPCVLGQVGTCPAPCAGRELREAYGRRVAAALAFLEGRDEAVLGHLETERERATDAQRFEIANRLERDLETLRDLRRRRERLAWVVGRQHFVVLAPTVDRETTQLYAVLGGRLAFETRLVAASDLVAAVRVVRERFERFRDAPLERDDVEAATIIAAWLRDRRQEGLIVPLDGPDDLEARFDELSITLTDPPPAGAPAGDRRTLVTTRRLVVAGDDFGASPEVNAGIVRAHRDGILTSASLMVTGDAVGEAVALARAHPRLGVGLHLVLAQARPAAPREAIPRLVRPDGNLRASPIPAGLYYAWLWCARRGREQMRRELVAQLEAFRATGLALTHLDGHLNMHLHPMILPMLCELAPRYGIRTMRLSYEDLGAALRYDRRAALRKTFEATVFGALAAYARPKLRAAGIKAAERVYGMHQTGHVDERYLLTTIASLPPGTSEIYGHPADGAPACMTRWQHGYDNAGEVAALTSPRVRQVVAARGVELIRYDEL